MPFFIFMLRQMFIILPALIIAEGWKRLSKLLTKKNWWWGIPYVLVIFLSLVVIVLLLAGYR